RDAEMNGARLGVVQHADAKYERQRRGVPELEERPGYGHVEQDLRCETRGFAAAGVGFGDELLELGWNLARSDRLVSHCAPAVFGIVAPCNRGAVTGAPSYACLFDPAFFLVVL